MFLKNRKENPVIPGFSFCIRSKFHKRHFLPDFGLIEYFKTVRAMGGRATRLDLACDMYNYSHLFSPLYMIYCY